MDTSSEIVDNQDNGLENILNELQACLEFTSTLRLYRKNIILKDQAPKKRKSEEGRLKTVGRPTKKRVAEPHMG